MSYPVRLSFTEQAILYKTDTPIFKRIYWRSQNLKNSMPYAVYINNVYTTDVLNQVDVSEPVNGLYDIDYLDSRYGLIAPPVHRDFQSRSIRISKVLTHINELILPGAKATAASLTDIAFARNCECQASKFRSKAANDQLVEPRHGWSHAMGASAKKALQATQYLEWINKMKTIFEEWIAAEGLLAIRNHKKL